MELTLHEQNYFVCIDLYVCGLQFFSHQMKDMKRQYYPLRIHDKGNMNGYLSIIVTCSKASSNYASSDILIVCFFTVKEVSV